MKNPYEVLGVSPSASEDEVRTAYKNMAMKYHPDIFEDEGAGADSFKMQEINEAYDIIIRKIRINSSGSRKSGDNQNTVSEYADVRRLISSGRLDDAEELLDGVCKESRNGEWNYLKGYILYKRGWLDEAESYVRKAYDSDPYSDEYKSLIDELDGSDESFFKMYKPNSLGCGPCSMCMSVCCMDLCCNCCGR